MSDAEHQIQQLLRERCQIVTELLNKEKRIHQLQVENHIGGSTMFTHYRPRRKLTLTIKSAFVDRTSLTPIKIECKLNDMGYEPIPLESICLGLYHGVLNGDFVTDGCGNYKVQDTF